MRLYKDKKKVVYVGYNHKDEPIYVGRGALSRAGCLIFNTEVHSVRTDEKFSVEYVDVYGPYSVDESIEKEKEIINLHRYDHNLYNIQLNHINENGCIEPVTELGRKILHDLKENKLTQSNIARKHNVSRQRVSQIKQKYT